MGQQAESYLHALDLGPNALEQSERESSGLDIGCACPLNVEGEHPGAHADEGTWAEAMEVSRRRERGRLRRS